jgi:phage tail tape-measure protein
MGGASVGLTVGASVVSVGPVVGEVVGETLGPLVGETLGPLEGLNVGEKLGNKVGVFVWHTPQDFGHASAIEENIPAGSQYGILHTAST